MREIIQSVKFIVKVANKMSKVNVYFQSRNAKKYFQVLVKKLSNWSEYCFGNIFLTTLADLQFDVVISIN